MNRTSSNIPRKSHSHGVEGVVVRNKKIIQELLEGGADFEKLLIVQGLQEDSATEDIVSLCLKRDIPVQRVPIRNMPKGRSGENHEVIAGILAPPKQWMLSGLLDHLDRADKIPFFLLINRIQYPNNIGLIARTAFAANVTGLLYQGDVGSIFNEEILHLSMGAIARIPLVKISIFEAVKELKEYGIPVYALTMDGTPYYNEHLTGGLALILGDEGEGLSETVLSRCDGEIGIPMQSGMNSLNVAVSASIVMYEKVRQESAASLT